MKKLQPQTVKKILALVRRGIPYDEIAEVVGVGVGSVHKYASIARAEARASAPLPIPVEQIDLDADVVVPDDATLQQIDEWLAVAKRSAAQADAARNARAHAAYMRMGIALLEARRKLAPAPTVEEVSGPDMVAAAAKVRGRFLELADELARNSKSPIAEMVAKRLAEKRAKEARK